MPTDSTVLKALQANALDCLHHGTTRAVARTGTRQSCATAIDCKASSCKATNYKIADDANHTLVHLAKKMFVKKMRPSFRTTFMASRCQLQLLGRQSNKVHMCINAPLQEPTLRPLEERCSEPFVDVAARR